ncbi:hypothetical protein PybrP1_012560 [[Pythium] brassicae (nom. inval.)]|nr:hypothetical protein PybrP1_012560 [[Pythium] brassicae (nom. inval.)]
MTKVLLLKAADAAYAAAFEQRALAPHFADVLAFEWVNEDAALTAISRLERFSALLVTSPRGASAVKCALEKLREGPGGAARYAQALERLRALPVYSVGRATSRELEALGVKCRGDECGSAEVLAELLHRDGELPTASATRPVLFACGEKRSAVLPESFRTRGLPLEELVVYRSLALASVELPAECARPQWVAFFSPSGLKAMVKAALPWAHVRKAAIGNTTAAAMRAHAASTGLSYWEADVVAPQPTADALADAIAAFERARPASAAAT